MTSQSPELVHGVAVAVAVDADGPLAGALILGPSGSGKSSLALMLIEACPFQRTALVADDAVILEARAAALIARSPERLQGLIEIRGFGSSKVRAVSACALTLAVDLGGAAERTPAPSIYQPAGAVTGVPQYPFIWKGAEASAPHRLRRMIASILGGQSAELAQDNRPL